MRELLQQALSALKAWDALIKHQYSGSSEAMNDMQYAAWNTVDVIAALEAELAKLEQGEMMQIKDGHLSYLKKPWVGLTDDEVFEFLSDGVDGREDINNIEEALRKKNERN